SCAHAPRIWPLLAALRAKNKVKRGTNLTYTLPGSLDSKGGMRLKVAEEPDCGIESLAAKC
ncbi:MAG: hypothetical protein LGR52_12695, partial [Candidatus Thiosymbion ectosymbiont of Robbea hypermnestra]|nr:hypothetical protein [Candidatus Thiosymbion ectosymbiont of Robbea hypermnestra]